MQLDNGDVPNYGSNDGALILPLTIADYRDFSAPMNTLYTYLKGKKLFKDKKYDEELIWLGKDEATNYEFEGIKRESKEFNNIGIYTLRNNDLFTMLVASNYKKRPAHMDGLHLDLWYKNENIFCDIGSYSYAEPEGKLFRQTGSHNTIKIDNLEQMNNMSNFFLYGWNKTKVIKHTQNELQIELYSINGYKQCRKIINNDKVLKIEDIVQTYNKNQYAEVIMHTPYKVNIEENIIKIYENNRICDIIINDFNAEIMVENGLSSVYYYNKKDINVIKIRKQFDNNNLIKFNYEVVIK